MLDEKFKAEYKEIKAPEELYSKIMNSDVPVKVKSYKPLVKQCASLAAAIAVILSVCAVFFSSSRNPVIYMGEDKLRDEVTLSESETAALMRRGIGDEIGCEFTLELTRETFISISDGFLADSSGEIILQAGESEKFDQTFFCKWSIIGADTEKSYEMILQDKNGIYIITLSFDSTFGKWTVGLTE